MKTLFVGVFLLMSAVAQADDIRTIRLSPIDSQRFDKALENLTASHSVADTMNSSLSYRVRVFVSKYGGLKLTCSTKIAVGLAVSAECVLQFNLTKSSTDLEAYEGKLAGALVAKMNDPVEATWLSQGIRFIPFVSTEKVRIQLPSGEVQSTPRLRIDCEKATGIGSVAKSCIIVAIPN